MPNGTVHPAIKKVRALEKAPEEIKYPHDYEVRRPSQARAPFCTDASTQNQIKTSNT